MSLQAMLAWHIKKNGTIPTVRVSSAQAKGAAKHYAYWGAVRYEIGVNRAGLPTNRALERASSDRRSRRLAESDAAAIAKEEGRLGCDRIGVIPEASCESWLADIYPAAIAKHQSRRPYLDQLLIAKQTRSQRANELRAQRLADRRLV